MCIRIPREFRDTEVQRSAHPRDHVVAGVRRDGGRTHGSAYMKTHRSWGEATTAVVARVLP